MERREFLAAVSVVAAGGSVAGLGQWLPAAPAGAAPVPARIGAGDVAQVRAMAAHLRALDERYGGGATLDAARGFVVGGMRNALARADEALADAEGAAVAVWAAQRAEWTARRAAGRGWLMIYAAVSRHRLHRRYAEFVVRAGTFPLADRSLGRVSSTNDRADLAAAQFRVGDRDAGIGNARAVLDDLPGLRSARARLWLADLSRAAADHAGHRGADDLRARIAAAN